MYAIKLKVDLKSLVFVFDGDKIGPDDTPGGLGMEDDDMIEVHIKSSWVRCLLSVYFVKYFTSFEDERLGKGQIQHFVVCTLKDEQIAYERVWKGSFCGIKLFGKHK